MSGLGCVNGQYVRSCSLVNFLLQYDLENTVVELSNLFRSLSCLLVKSISR